MKVLCHSRAMQRSDADQAMVEGGQSEDRKVLDGQNQWESRSLLCCIASRRQSLVLWGDLRRN